jgi:hypothetical protein
MRLPLDVGRKLDRTVNVARDRLLGETVGYGRDMADEPTERPLEDLQRQIDDAREKAEDAIPELEDDEQRFYESGEEKGDQEQRDDQTIAPPG